MVGSGVGDSVGKTWIGEKNGAVAERLIELAR